MSIEHGEVVEKHGRRTYRAGFLQTQLAYNSFLNVDSDFLEFTGTGILCTVGPTCANTKTLTEMIRAGMCIAKFDFSRDSYADNRAILDLVRDSTSNFSEYHRLMLMVDVKGPEIMTGMNQKNEPITLVKGQKVILTTDDEYKENCTSEHLYVNFPSLLQSVNAGEPIYLDDGRVKLIIEQLRKCDAICEVVYGGTFGSFKNVRLLRFPTDLPSLSEKDISDISFSAQENFDAVIAFIRNENNIKELRNVLEKIDQGKHMKIISKIANHEGVENINKILEASDAILVCKNSLGLEIGPERAVIAQKKILSVCKLRGKPVICCVQISEKSIHENLDSSIEAEVVMSNLLDGADCLMLFDDNSQCHTPVQALKKLKLFVEAAETIYRTGLHFENIKKAMFLITPEQISALAAVEISYSLKANAIIVLTTTGRTAELVSTFKPRCLIFAVTRSQRVCRSLHLYRSVCPIIYNYQPVEPWIEDIKARFTYTIRYLVEYGVLRIGSHVVLLTGWKPGPGFSNTLRAGTVNDEFSIASLCEQSNHNL